MVGDSDRPAVHLSQTARDRQTETGAGWMGPRLLTSGGAPERKVEDPVQIGLVDAAAGVVDEDPCVSPTRSELTRTVPPGSVCRTALDTRLWTTRSSSTSRPRTITSSVITTDIKTPAA
jgi:hypothetical protein